MTALEDQTGVTGARPVRRHAFHPLRVSGIERLTADAVAVSFAVPPELAEDYLFQAGQHLTLRTVLDGRELRRSYSICSSATSGTLRVAVKRLPGGLFSAWVHEGLRVGDQVDVMTPSGRFVLTPRPGDGAVHRCAFAAGSGITPVLSIVATALEAERESTFTLVYGNRTTGDVMFLEELADLKDRYPSRLQVLHVLSGEPQESELLTGRIDRDKVQRLLGGLLDAGSVDEWFLCGPYRMVETVRAALLHSGVPNARVHVELFRVEGEPAVGEPSAAAPPDQAGTPTSSVSVVLDVRRTTVAVDPARERVLDAVLRVRPDAPYACKGGVCGTCRAKVVAGEVDMATNYALEPDELAAGFVLACQARPRTATVHLDFDA